MRYSPQQLNKKRRRKANRPIDNNASPNAAIFCSFDDTLMVPAMRKASPRSSRMIQIYFCPKCSNEINPRIEAASYGMTVQTADNAIPYHGKKKTISYIPMRSYASQVKREDDMSQFLADATHEDLYTHVTKRIIEKKGVKIFRIDIHK